MQIRKALLDGRAETGTPETTASSMGSGSGEVEWMQRDGRGKEQRQDEEDDEWMWGGMKCFGGEEGEAEGVAATERSAGI